MTEQTLPPLEADRGDAGLKTRVLRELIRTPAFRELVKLNLADVDPARARQLVRTALWEDPNLSLSAAAVSPQAINYLVEALLELGKQLGNLAPKLTEAFVAETVGDIDFEKMRQALQAWAPLVLREMPGLLRAKLRAGAALAEALDQLPPDERAALRSQAARGCDGDALAAAVNAWTKAAVRLRRENPDLAVGLTPALENAVAKIDFGQLREAIVAFAEYDVELCLAALTPALRDPVVFANLAVTLPQLVNQLVKLAAGTLSKVDLPAEILASSVFGLLGDLDMRAFADLTNVVAQLLCDLGKGDATLGGDEPGLRRVLAEMIDGYLDYVDLAVVVGAVRALGTDVETVAGVLAELPRRNAEFLLAVVAVGTIIDNAVVRSMATVFENAAALPDDVLQQAGQHLGANLEARELGRMISAGARFQERFWDANPDLCFVGDVLSALDGKQLAATTGKAAGRMGRAVLADPGVQEALSAEAVGQKINGWLVAFNRAMQDKREGRSYPSRLLGEIDPVQLRLALRHLTATVTGALAENARQGRAIVSSLVGAMWSLARVKIIWIKRRLLRQDDSAARS